MPVTVHPDTEQAAIDWLRADADSLERDAGQVRRLLQLAESGQAVVVMAEDGRGIDIDLSEELIDKYDLRGHGISWPPRLVQVDAP